MADDEVVYAPLVAGCYAVHSLRLCEARLPWPDSAQGSASRLCIQDLAEFLEVAVAAAGAGNWSVVKALDRMVLDRMDVLAGAAAKKSFAERYCKAVMLQPDPNRPLKPRVRARAEDAFDALASSLKLDRDAVHLFKNAWRSLRDASSDWHIHPTAAGPLLSRQLVDEPAEAVQHWGLLLDLVGNCLFWAMFAAMRIAGRTNIEILRALDGVAKAQAEIGYSGSRWDLIAAEIAQQAAP